MDSETTRENIKALIDCDDQQLDQIIEIAHKAHILSRGNVGLNDFVDLIVRSQWQYRQAIEDLNRTEKVLMDFLENQND